MQDGTTKPLVMAQAMKSPVSLNMYILCVEDDGGGGHRKGREVRKESELSCHKETLNSKGPLVSSE